MARASDRLFLVGVTGLLVTLIPIWRGAGHPRTKGVSFWKMLHDSTNLQPSSPFGHAHIRYEEAMERARRSWTEHCCEE